MDWFIVDGHEDIAMALLESEGRVFGGPPPAGQALSLDAFKEGGLGLVLATIFAPAGYWPGQTAQAAADAQLRCYEDILDRYASDLFRVESRGDLALCRAGGPIGILHLMEGADPIRSVRDLPRWAERGVRVIGPAWNTGNRYCGGKAERSGLTPAGVDLIREMRALDIVPDMSHLTPVAFDDVLAQDDGLVVASHSNAHALCGHPRNLTDEQLTRVAERDGLVGVVLFNPFLGTAQVDLDTVVQHIDHMVELIGPAHVGLGSDLDGGFTTADAPAGIDTVADLGQIGEKLAARGYPEADIEMIMGGNWLRILRHALPE